jgi:hypothetical protein
MHPPLSTSGSRRVISSARLGRLLYCSATDGANDLDLREGGSRIGRLWLHNAEQFEEETDAVTQADGRTALIDVVAISRSSCAGADKDGEPLPFKDRINILWVKWDKGIAYRLASGYVYEEYWDGLDLEEIDLVLG